MMMKKVLFLGAALSFLILPAAWSLAQESERGSSSGMFQRTDPEKTDGNQQLPGLNSPSPPSGLSRPGRPTAGLRGGEERTGAENRLRGKADTAPPAMPLPSSVEESFRQSPVPLGEVFSADSRVAPAFKDPIAEQEEKLQKSIFTELVTAPEDLSLRERVRLFRGLDEVRQSAYLKTLSPNERRPFLAVVGEEQSVWSLQDLKSPGVERNLKQFGFQFFETLDPAFLPDRMAPVGPDYILGPGDTLVIDLWGAIEGHYETTVDRNGTLTLPKIGAVNLWGQSFAQARETLRQQVAKYFSNFEINVTMGGLRSIQVYLVGEVNSPGTYTVSSMATILNALTLAGGPSRSGSLRDVQLVRAGQVISRVDFYDFFMAGDRSRDLRLQSGDTIHVPISGAQVGVAGDVRRPAIYELKGGETLHDLLQMAGGFQSTAYLKKVQVERVLAHEGRKVIDLDLAPAASEDAAALDFAMQDRDFVQVYSISPAKNRYVKLKGYVARPGLYQFEQGMRISDLLLRYDNLLPFYYTEAVEILRLRPPLYVPEKITVNLRQALAHQPEDDIYLVAHDEVTVFSREEMEEAASVRVSGAVQNPGTFRFFDNMTVRDLVIAGGNVKRGAYLGDAEVTRFEHSAQGTSSRQILIDLGDALAGDPEHNLWLHPDDHLFVRAIPDFADKPLIRVEGEVKFPGEYAIGKGEKLSSLLARAGGFTDKAYLRGSTFTREAVQAMQQKRFQELILEQEQEILRASTEIASGALSAEEIKAAQTLLESRQEMIAKLKELPITGRMVVNLAPLDDLRDSEYDIELEDGDTLTIPTNPKTVTVLGQVYNPITLTFNPSKSVSYYLNKVGGTKDDANTDEMFIVRADGTVFSKQQAGAGVSWDSENFRWVFGGFNNTQIYPGDTILVPEEFKRIDIMREVKDLTQIFYQIALGAAAVASF